MSIILRLASTLGLAAALLTSACGQVPGGAAGPRQPFAALASQQQPRLHTFTSDAEGFDTHSHWYDTGREVVVFDAQFTPALAERLIASIRATTRSPITTLVITHPNPDKFNGATAFQAIGAEVVASAATAQALPGVHAYKRRYFVEVAKRFTADTYPPLPKVDRTFGRELRLPLRGGEVQLRVLAHAGAASTHTVAYLPAARALIVGDLVHHRVHAWLEGGIVAGVPRLDVDAWVAALGELKAYRGATVYGGRGPAAPVAVAIAGQQAYLLEARAIVRAYVDALGPRAGELDGDGAAAHHVAIAQRIAAAFPAHDLGYLTPYSVYGLIKAVRATAP